jgi:hypothetical protein
MEQIAPGVFRMARMVRDRRAAMMPHEMTFTLNQETNHLTIQSVDLLHDPVTIDLSRAYNNRLDDIMGAAEGNFASPQGIQWGVFNNSPLYHIFSVYDRNNNRWPSIYITVYYTPLTGIQQYLVRENIDMAEFIARFSVAPNVPDYERFFKFLDDGWNGIDDISQSFTVGDWNANDDPSLDLCRRVVARITNENPHALIPQMNNGGHNNNVQAVIRNIPAGSTNVISWENIQDGANLVNFPSNPDAMESEFGRYYTAISFNQLQEQNGRKINPHTRHVIEPERVVRYRARLVAPLGNGGGNVAAAAAGGGGGGAQGGGRRRLHKSRRHTRRRVNRKRRAATKKGRK